MTRNGNYTDLGDKKRNDYTVLGDKKWNNYTLLGDDYYKKFSVFSFFPPFPFSKNILHYGFYDVQVQLKNIFIFSPTRQNPFKKFTRVISLGNSRK